MHRARTLLLTACLLLASASAAPAETPASDKDRTCLQLLTQHRLAIATALRKFGKEPPSYSLALSAAVADLHHALASAKVEDKAAWTMYTESHRELERARRLYQDDANGRRARDCYIQGVTLVLRQRLRSANDLDMSIHCGDLFNHQFRAMGSIRRAFGDHPRLRDTAIRNAEMYTTARYGRIATEDTDCVTQLERHNKKIDAVFPVSTPDSHKKNARYHSILKSLARRIFQTCAANRRRESGPAGD